MNFEWKLHEGIKCVHKHTKKEKTKAPQSHAKNPTSNHMAMPIQHPYQRFNIHRGIPRISSISCCVVLFSLLLLLKFCVWFIRVLLGIPKGKQQNSPEMWIALALTRIPKRYIRNFANMMLPVFEKKKNRMNEWNQHETLEHADGNLL